MYSTNNNTIYANTSRGPPGLAAAYANPQAFEMPFAESIPKGYTQSMFSAYKSDNVAITPTVLAVAAIPEVNSRACDNCIKTLAMTDPEVERCFRFDPYLPNGATIPMGAVNTQQCKRVVYDALNRCAERCSSCAGV